MTINGETQLIGLIGWPVAHSLSPAMHNAAANALNLNVIYVPLPVRPDALETAVHGLCALGFRGVNVTIPHKQAVIPYLDVLDDAARIIGAVNTIVMEEVESGEWRVASRRWRLSGYNTDWSGFRADLERYSVAVAGRDCLVLGAGGSARAVVYALAQEGGRITILARRPEQAIALINDLELLFPGVLAAGSLSDLAERAADCEAPLIVNTTPLGMEPRIDESPWQEDLPFPVGSFIYDLVYRPLLTRFIRQAADAGCGTANGLGMLANQAAQAFMLWTGTQAGVVERFSQIAQAIGFQIQIHMRRQ
jgi:shikimate dehydrogenase